MVLKSFLVLFFGLLIGRTDLVCGRELVGEETKSLEHSDNLAAFPLPRSDILDRHNDHIKASLDTTRIGNNRNNNYENGISVNQRCNGRCVSINNNNNNTVGNSNYDKNIKSINVDVNESDNGDQGDSDNDTRIGANNNNTYENGISVKQKCKGSCATLNNNNNNTVGNGNFDRNKGSGNVRVDFDGNDHSDDQDDGVTRSDGGVSGSGGVDNGSDRGDSLDPGSNDPIGIPGPDQSSLSPGLMSINPDDDLEEGSGN